MALAFLLMPFPASSQTLIGKFIRDPVRPAPGHYFAFFVRGTKEQDAEALANDLARLYHGAIQIISPRRFRVAMSEEAAIALSQDPRVEYVADYPLDERPVPSGKYRNAQTPRPEASAKTEYFVRLAPAIADEKVTPTAHALARAYDGRIRLINLRGFQVEMAAESVRALSWDERVEMVAPYPRVLAQAPAARFVGSATHGGQDYRVRLADSGRRYDPARVAQIGLDLAAQYRSLLTGAFAPSIGRPWVVLKARPPMARALSLDKRVAWVAEEGTPAAAVSPDVALKPLARGPKPPERAAKKGPPELARGTLQRASRHFKDWYFVVLDPARTDVSTTTSIAASADAIAAATGTQRLGGEFLKAPYGFRVSGTEEAALRVARDPRVSWVEEIGPYVRTPDPRPGEYGVGVRKPVPALEGEGGLRAMAEDLADTHGGRVTYVWSFGGFALADLSELSARDMSEDPRIEYVEENCCLTAGDSSPEPIVVDRQSTAPTN